jgi:secreted trypsin-like serine protease
MFFNYFAIILLIFISSTVCELEDFTMHRQEVSPALGNGTFSEHVSFMASLRLKAIDSPYGSGHICGAVFITRQHLLTAAVCVVKIDRDIRADELEVVAGTRLRYDDNNAHRLAVAQVIVPLEYQRFPVMGMDGNLAILTVTINLIGARKFL